MEQGSEKGVKTWGSGNTAFEYQWPIGHRVTQSFPEHHLAELAWERLCHIFPWGFKAFPAWHFHEGNRSQFWPHLNKISEQIQLSKWIS